MMGFKGKVNESIVKLNVTATEVTWLRISISSMLRNERLTESEIETLSELHNNLGEQFKAKR